MLRQGTGTAVPPGFDVLRFPPRQDSAPRRGRPGPGRFLLGPGERRVILRSSDRDRLLEAGIQDPEGLMAGPLVQGWLEGGRTRHAIIRIEDSAWVMKSYRRGGVVGKWNSARYWGQARFLEELQVAALAAEKDVPTAEVLALVIEEAGLGSVRAWLATRFLPGVRPVHEYFGDPREAEVFLAAGRIVARMHAAGIDHPDLHLGNIVVSSDSRGVHAHIVDWDRARRRAGSAWTPNANLARLWRSVEKGRHAGDPHPLRKLPMRSFIRGYFEGRPAALAEARRYFRRRAFFLGMRIWIGRKWR